MARPSSVSMKNSAWVKERISGWTRGIDRPSTTAPSSPPMAETVNAAPKAREASPFMAIG